jgi:hypothetical protein
MIGPMASLGYPEGTLEIFQVGERLSRELGDEKSHANFLSVMGIYYVLKGEDLLLAIQYSENSFKEAEKIHDIELMVPTGLHLCLSCYFLGDCLKAVKVASKVIALLDKTQRQAEFFFGPLNIYSFLHTKYATCTRRMGNFDEGNVLFEKGLDFALKIKDLFSLGSFEMDLGWDLNLKGNPQTAIVHLQNSIRYCEEGQIVMYLGAVWIGLGWAYCLLGELETARKHIEKAFKISGDVGSQVWKMRNVVPKKP